MNRLISVNIFLELGRPKLQSAFWHICIFTAFMPVPKASVYKHSNVILFHPYIWMTGDMRSIKPVSISVSMKKMSEEQFRRSIFTFYCRHISASIFSRFYISHFSSPLYVTAISKLSRSSFNLIVCLRIRIPSFQVFCCHNMGIYHLQENGGLPSDALWIEHTPFHIFHR